MAKTGFTSPERTDEDRQADQVLRPRTLDEFVGQPRTVKNLRYALVAARERREPPDHVLFSGPPGLGKTTLAQIVAREMGANFHATSGPALERSGDLVGILTKLGEGDVLFIDEIHRLHPAVEEYLYSAMEDYVVDIVLDQGPGARSIRLTLKPFTLVGATTREGLLSPPFRDRFLIRERLDLYPKGDLVKILVRAAGLLKVGLAPDAADHVAACSRGTPRVAQRFLRRLRDVAQVEGGGEITLDLGKHGLDMLGVDARGLEEMDRRIIRALVESGAAPLGLKTLAVRVGEPEDTLEDVYEPYLIQLGYLQRTPRGRLATEKAMREFGGDGAGTRKPKTGTLF
ncbi:MAG: Holliday junction branch migration DNA helicase RuvB [Planctomycetales bacterium]|nr:Holliday junction branch migration DNA helicase RuvB [Planctomycetales bacterium]